ncbi:MAG: hypothetical protein ACI8S6_003350, partial [Myxococcota bacterium]
MIRRSRALTGLILSLSLVLACSGGGADDLEPPQRHATATEADAEARASELILPVTLSTAFIAEAVSAATPDPIYADDAVPLMASVMADTTVRRDGDISVAVRGESLRLTVPVRVKVEAYRERSDGSRGTDLGTVRAKMNLFADMTFAISDDWSLVADTELSYRWTRSPTLTVGSIKLDIASLLDPKLEEQLPAMAAQLEAELRKSKALRAEARKVWLAFQYPRVISKDPRVSLQLTAAGLSASDPVVTEEGLALTLGTTGVVAVTLGKVETDSAPPTRLPDRLPSSQGTRSQLFLPLYLSWDELTEQARGQLVGQSISSPLPAGAGEATAVITDVLGIYPSGDQLAVGVTLDARVPGADLAATVWMLGRPELVTHSQVLSLRDFSFAAATDSAVADLALKALYEKLREAAEQQLTLPLGPHLRALRGDADEAFGGSQEVAEGVELDAT